MFSRVDRIAKRGVLSKSLGRCTETLLQRQWQQEDAEVNA